jgi:serine/threonine-protein kinase
MKAQQMARFLGRYYEYAPLASGRIATVSLGSTSARRFLASRRDERPHQRLATNTHLITMFLDEARLAARIHHPNVSTERTRRPTSAARRST